MKKVSVFFMISVLALAIVFLTSVVQAQEKVATPAQARELLNKFVAYTKANGCEKAFDEVSKGTAFKIYKNAYPSPTSFEGISLAHGKYPNLAGQNILNTKDVNGKLFVKISLEKRKKNFNDASPTEYQWMDTKTNKVETRSLIAKGYNCGGKYGDVSLSITYEGKM